jgi:hypothetical protein
MGEVAIRLSARDSLTWLCSERPSTRSPVGCCQRSTLLGAPEAKKARPVPGRPGDGPRDGGEAGIGRLLPDIAVWNDGDGLPLALVLTNKHSAALEAPWAIRSRIVAPQQASEMLRGFRIKPTEGLLLDVPAKEPRDEILGEGRGGDERSVVRHRVRSSSRPSGRTRSISASIASRSSVELGMPVTPFCDRICLCASARHASPRSGRLALRPSSRRKASGRAFYAPPPSKNHGPSAASSQLLP